MKLSKVREALEVIAVTIIAILIVLACAGV